MRARYGKFVTGEDGLVLPFLTGHSYTGEESVEFHIHGSPAGVRLLLERCIAEGARAAEPGEFTLRAFMNGRMDLSQAEAVRDTVEAETALQLENANQGRSQALRERLAHLTSRLQDLLATIEAHVDFSEELGDIDEQDFTRELESIRSQLEDLYKSASIGRILREGFRIAIVGPPNAGKSSLLNALLGSQRAIVTPIAGTTRDTLEESLDFDGLKVVLTDTAGLRDSDDPVEVIGIDRARHAAAESDQIWLVYDSVQGWTPELERLQVELGQNVLILANKIDLLDSGALTKGHPISCFTGQGLSELVASTKIAALGDFRQGPTLSPRQAPSLEAAIEAIGQAQACLEHNRPSDLLSVCLSSSLHELGRITGETADADLLECIFHGFCIGK